ASSAWWPSSAHHWDRWPPGRCSRSLAPRQPFSCIRRCSWVFPCSPASTNRCTGLRDNTHGVPPRVKWRGACQLLDTSLPAFFANIVLKRRLAMHERKADVRYIPLPQAPRNRGFTILLAVLWGALLLYILTHPDPFGFILIGVFTVFILPLFILAFRLRL